MNRIKKIGIFSIVIILLSTFTYAYARGSTETEPELIVESKEGQGDEGIWGLFVLALIAADGSETFTQIHSSEAVNIYLMTPTSSTNITTITIIGYEYPNATARLDYYMTNDEIGTMKFAELGAHNSGLNKTIWISFIQEDGTWQKYYFPPLF